MKLFGYWQSSATWRVRLALGLKGLDYTYKPVNLLGEEQSSALHLSRNPQGLVPALETDDGAILTQSLAIIHYLERVFPQTSILPTDPVQAAKAEAIATMIACEAQPFGNRRVLQSLKNDHGFTTDQIKGWMNRWPGATLRAVETLLSDQPGVFCFDNKPGIAEIFIIPQLYAARRFGADIDDLHRLLAIEAACADHSVFHAAHPFQQPDRPENKP